MWLVDLYRFQNICSIEFEVIGDITDSMKEKPYQQMKATITKNLEERIVDKHGFV